MTSLDFILEKYGVALSFSQVTRILGIGKDSLKTLLRRGEIRSRRAGSRWLIPAEAICEYLNREPVVIKRNNRKIV